MLDVIYNLLFALLMFMGGYATSEFVRYYKSIGPVDGGGV